MFRIIHGAKYENWEWNSRTNQELEGMSKGENTVKWIKEQRISWLGHLERMGEDRMSKGIWKGQDVREDRKGWKGEVESERDGDIGEMKGDCSTGQSHGGL
jgi:hypothetical protein